MLRTGSPGAHARADPVELGAEAAVTGRVDGRAAEKNDHEREDVFGDSNRTPVEERAMAGLVPERGEESTDNVCLYPFRAPPRSLVARAVGLVGEGLCFSFSIGVRVGPGGDPRHGSNAHPVVAATVSGSGFLTTREPTPSAGVLKFTAISSPLVGSTE